MPNIIAINMRHVYAFFANGAARVYKLRLMSARLNQNKSKQCPFDNITSDILSANQNISRLSELFSITTSDGTGLSAS